MTENKNNEQIIIYQTESGDTQIDVRLEQDSVWLSQAQMVELFDRDKRTISEHIGKIFKEGELQAGSVVRKFRITASDGKTYEVNQYNLDVIISVGYRVKSTRGTQFRIWANNVLKQYLIQGYALNERKLQAEQEKLGDLNAAITLIARLAQNKALTDEESQSILTVLAQYSHALTVLDDYDHQRLQIIGTTSLEQPKIGYDEAINQIHLWREKEKLGGLFGNEKDDSFKGSLETIYQTFDEEELYPTIEEKAANLL
jgi:hypothetical protein